MGQAERGTAASDFPRLPCAKFVRFPRQTTDCSVAISMGRTERGTAASDFPRLPCAKKVKLIRRCAAWFPVRFPPANYLS